MDLSNLIVNIFNFTLIDPDPQWNIEKSIQSIEGNKKAIKAYVFPTDTSKIIYQYDVTKKQSAIIFHLIININNTSDKSCTLHKITLELLNGEKIIKTVDFEPHLKILPFTSIDIPYSDRFSDSGEESLEPTISSQQSLEPITSPQQSLEQTTSPKQALEPITSTKQALEPITSPQQVLKPTTFSHQSLKPTTFSQQSLKPTTFSHQSLKPTTFSQQSLKPNISSHELSEVSTSHQSLKPTTFSHQSLKPTISSHELSEASTSHQSLKPGTSSRQSLKPGISSRQSFKPGTFSHQSLKPTTFSHQSLEVNTFSHKSLKPIISSHELSEANTSHQSLQSNTSSHELPEANTSHQSLKPSTSSRQSLKPIISSHELPEANTSHQSLKPPTSSHKFPEANTFPHQSLELKVAVFGSSLNGRGWFVIGNHDFDYQSPHKQLQLHDDCFADPISIVDSSISLSREYLVINTAKVISEAHLRRANNKPMKISKNKDHNQSLVKHINEGSIVSTSKPISTTGNTRTSYNTHYSEYQLITQAKKVVYTIYDYSLEGKVEKIDSPSSLLIYTVNAQRNNLLEKQEEYIITGSFIIDALSYEKSFYYLVLDGTKQIEEGFFDLGPGEELVKEFNIVSDSADNDLTFEITWSHDTFCPGEEGSLQRGEELSTLKKEIPLESMEEICLNRLYCTFETDTQWLNPKDKKLPVYEHYTAFNNSHPNIEHLMTKEGMPLTRLKETISFVTRKDATQKVQVVVQVPEINNEAISELVFSTK